MKFKQANLSQMVERLQTHTKYGGYVLNPEDKDSENKPNFLPESTYFPPRFQHAACTVNAAIGKEAI